MNRRRFLAGTAIFSVGSAGCLGSDAESDIADGMAVESHHSPGIVLVDDEQVVERLELDDAPVAYHELFTDSETAENRLEDEEQTNAFVGQTYFDESYLLVVVAGYWSSSDELELEGTERTNSALHVEIRTVSRTTNSWTTSRPIPS